MKKCLLTVVMMVSSSLASAQTAIPTIATGGVVNAADYTSAISPGSLIAVFGDGMASKITSASGAPLPVSLDGTSLEVNGQPIPLFFVSQRQINAQMPFGLSGTVQVRVRTAVGLSAAATLNVLPTAPRLFTKTMDGKGEPILIHGADWTLVSAASPAVTGEYLILFLTGLGAVNPPLAAGQAAGTSGTLHEAPGVTVSYGGKPAPIAFAGLAPGFAGLYQINFQVPAGANGSAVAVNGPMLVTAAASGSGKYGSSSRLAISWTPPAYPVDRYETTATESIQNTRVTVSSKTPETTLTGLKSATTYNISVKACQDLACTQSLAAAPVTASTAPEYWKLQGSGGSTAGLSRIVSDGNAKISATRFGSQAGPVTADRIQLYYGASGLMRAVLTTALTMAPSSTSSPSSYLNFVSSRGTTGLLSPTAPALMVQTVATGQGVPMFNGKVRLFFEAQGDDRRTRIFSVDSVDGFTGQDFNTGSSTTCSTAADFSPGGGCLLTVAIGIEGDAVQANARIPNARQHKIGYPTLTDWRWTGAPGTFMVFTTDRINNCTVANMNHGYAVWDGTNWKVRYDSAGCPKLFPYAQAAFPMHTGGVRYKLYYGDTAITTGRIGGQLPFLGPKKLIYADGTSTGAPDRVDFEDWENQSNARDVVFLWPNGEVLNDTAEGYIDDYHFLTPTGSMDLQVMYMAITNGTEFPFAAAAILVNP